MPFDLFLLIVLWLAILYLPFAMRSWRAFLVLCAVYLLFGAAVRFGVATYSAADVPAVLVFIGNVWLDVVVGVLPIPVIARAAVLGARSLGLGGRPLLAANIAALLALPATGLGIFVHDRWERRPAPAACVARPIPLTLAGIGGAVPWSGAISLHVGPDIWTDGRHLVVPAHRRRICRDTEDGTLRIAVTAVSLRLDREQEQRCGAPDIRPWENAPCDRGMAGRAAHLPDRIVFFDPDGIRPGDFGIPEQGASGGVALTNDQRVVTVANAKVGTVSAVCLPPTGADGVTYCRMRRRIDDGFDLYWSIGAPLEDLGEALPEAEAFAREVCSDVLDLPGCALSETAAP